MPAILLSRLRAVPALLLTGVVCCAAAAPAAPTAASAAASPVAASANADDAAERRALQAQKKAIEERYQQSMKNCARQFVVTSCEREARQARGDALKPVTSREMALDAQQRLSRAAEQRARVQTKQQAFDAQEAERMQRALNAPAPAPAPAASPSRPVRADPAAHAKQVQKELAESRRAAERTRDQAALRRSEADAHRSALQRREKEREASSKKPGIALPVPSASAIAALPAMPSQPASAASR